MNLSCYIIDHDPQVIELFNEFNDKSSHSQFVGGETDFSAGLKKLGTGEVVADIVFFGDGLGCFSDVEFEGLMKVPYVFFVTGDRGLALDVYENRMIDFLLKPLSYERFLAAVNRARLRLSHRKWDGVFRDHFYIQGRGKGKFVRVQRDDIFYLESAGNYTKIHLKDGLQITHSSLKEMEVLLCADQFIRVHRSYVLNMNKVVSVDGNVIQLCNGSAVMLGSNYQKDFFDYIFPTSSKFRK